MLPRNLQRYHREAFKLSRNEQKDLCQCFFHTKTRKNDAKYPIQRLYEGQKILWSFRGKHRFLRVRARCQKSYCSSRLKTVFEKVWTYAPAQGIKNHFGFWIMKIGPVVYEKNYVRDQPFLREKSNFWPVGRILPGFGGPLIQTKIWL